MASSKHSKSRETDKSFRRNSPNLQGSSAGTISFPSTRPSKLKPIEGLITQKVNHFSDANNADASSWTDEPPGIVSTEDILRSCKESDCLKVTVIDLHGSKLHKICDLKKFSRLKRLDLSGNNIQIIENLDSNQQLRELKLYDNNISVIENLDCLKDLRDLHLQFNAIVRVGSGLKNLTNLTSLRLDNNRLGSIDRLEVSHLSKNLKILDLSNNDLVEIAPLSSLSSLEELNVSSNDIVNLPNLSNLAKIIYLNCSHNKIQSLTGLRDCSSLVSLDLAFNRINNDSLEKLGATYTQLDVLNLSYNQLSSLTKFSEIFPALTVLHLSHCDIDGEQISHLKTLALREIEIEHCTNLDNVNIPDILPLLEFFNGKPYNNYSIPTNTDPNSIHPIGALVEKQMKEIEVQMTFEYEDMLHKFQSCRSTIASNLPKPGEDLSQSVDQPISKLRSRLLHAKKFSEMND